MEPSAGQGELALACARGRTRVVRARASSPLHLRTPRNHGHAAWVYATSFGGGLVDGDSLALEVEVGAGAAGFVSTQGPTRVYRSPAGCRSSLSGAVSDAGLLVAAPDPISLFAGARCEQRISFALHPDASLVWADVLGAGRVARGERWAFQRLDSRLEVRRASQLLLDERLVLDPKD